VAVTVVRGPGFHLLKRLGRRLCRALSFPVDGGDDEGEVPNGLLVEEPVPLWNERLAEGPAGMAIEDDMVRVVELSVRTAQEKTRGIGNDNVGV